MKKIVIYGNGHYANMLYHDIVQEKAFEIVTFTADSQYIKAPQFLNLPLIAFSEVEKQYPPDSFDMLVIIAFSKMRDREHMFKKAKSKGYRLVNYIAASAEISDTCTFGENNIVGPGSYIGPFAKVRDNNLIRPHTYIGHDTKIHSHNYIAPGCKIGGECEIKDSSFIGIGTIIRDMVTIERETLIGAGSLVLKNTEPFSKYIGSPAKKNR